MTMKLGNIKIIHSLSNSKFYIVTLNILTAGSLICLFIHSIY